MLKLQGVQKNYQNFKLNCSLEVRPGCITGLIGQNGAGKSTTFKAILGLISTDGGSIEVFDKPIAKLNARDKEQLGVVLSDSGFSSYLCVRDLPDILKHLYSSFHHDIFMTYCEKFQIPMDKKIMDFSTGMKAKLKVLIALSHDAQLLILDEPTAGLDVVARDDLLDMLRSYMEEHEDAAILISSHISSDLEGLCDDLYMIHEGTIVLHEETDVLLSDYAVLKVDEEHFAKLDHSYLLKKKKESYGYSILTNQKSFYVENYPDITIEKGSIDDALLIMIRGEDVC